MRKVLYLIALLFFPGISGQLRAQEVRVSDPVMAMVGNSIHITYDILNSNSAQEYSVGLEIKDAQGKVLNARSLSGDIGDRVNGGSDKRIIWDYENDHASLDGDIFVKVNVKPLESPAPVVTTPPEGNPAKQYSRTGLILQSVAFPGLGLSRYRGGPHWVKGVLGYGCIAGSIYMNRAAINTYAGIIDESDLDLKNQLLDDALRQDNISEVLAYTAIALWLTDLVWTFVGTSDLDNKSAYQRRVKVNTKIDHVSKTPLLAFTYQF